MFITIFLYLQPVYTNVYHSTCIYFTPCVSITIFIYHNKVALFICMPVYNLFMYILHAAQLVYITIYIFDFTYQAVLYMTYILCYIILLYFN